MPKILRAKYIKAIGYRKEDMPKRVTLYELSQDKKRIAPLLTDFDQPISQRDLNVFFDNEQFKLGIHSKLGNCELCWKKSERLRRTRRTGPTSGWASRASRLFRLIQRNNFRGIGVRLCRPRPAAACRLGETI